MLRKSSKFLDPKNKLFKGRVYAQEFFKSYRSKVTLLQTLFPDNMKPPVVMLDDCSDVWNDNENLVKVIPYCDREQDSEEIRYLDCLARVLQQIHTEFFSQLNTAELGASILPDIGKIKDRLRSGVLNGVYIVYGGNSSDKLHRRLCQMGATVRKTVVHKAARSSNGTFRPQHTSWRNLQLCRKM